MASRFGMFYDEKTGKSYTDSSFQHEYIPKSHHHPKTPVHARAFEQDRKRSAGKRKKQHDKENKEKKKHWKENGCGHKNIKMFGFFRDSPETPKDKEDSSCSKKPATFTPVSSEKPESLNSPVSDKDDSKVVASQVVSSHSHVGSPSVKSTSSSSSSSIEVTKVVNGKDVLNETLSIQGSGSGTSEGGVDSEDEEDEFDPDDINVQDIEPEETDAGVDDKFMCRMWE